MGAWNLFSAHSELQQVQGKPGGPAGPGGPGGQTGHDGGGITTIGDGLGGDGGFGFGFE